MKRIVIILIFSISLLACNKEEDENLVIIQGSGDINEELTGFRNLLGGQLNTTPGVTGGRREINWDAIPDTLLGQRLANNFFNATEPGAPVSRQRGLVYSGGGGEFMVSNMNFAEVNSEASSEFGPFSGDKIFANTSSALWEIGFEVPGQTEQASVKGFGAVFSDVDLPNSTSLEFFNESRSLGKFFAPPHDGSSSFSFLGVYFKNAERITRIRVNHDGILAGGGKDISNNGAKDLIVLDDLLYSEPVKK